MQPGILTIGIPTSEVTGGYIGTAMDGSVIHCGVVGMFISRILIGLISRPTKGIISLQSIFESLLDVLPLSQSNQSGLE